MDGWNDRYEVYPGDRLVNEIIISKSAEDGEVVGMLWPGVELLSGVNLRRFWKVAPEHYCLSCGRGADE